MKAMSPHKNRSMAESVRTLPRKITNYLAICLSLHGASGAMLLALVALLLLSAGTAQAQTATAAPIVGEVERLTLTNFKDIYSGGVVVVGGQNIIIPRNLLIDFPANRLTLQQAFSQAPPGCVARAESGLAKADFCNASKTGAIITIRANHTSAGNTIAGDIFVQKGVETVKGVVTYINHTDGYFRLNGTLNDATTGVMVRLNDPGNRHTVQQGSGCLAGSVNCSPDPRFTLDRDTTRAFSPAACPYAYPAPCPAHSSILLTLMSTATQPRR
jgi:hypothetical protein